MIERLIVLLKCYLILKSFTYLLKFNLKKILFLENNNLSDIYNFLKSKKIIRVFI